MLFWHLAAYQSISIAHIAFLVHWTRSCLGEPTQQFHAFKQPMDHIEFRLSLQDLILLKLSLDHIFMLFPEIKLKK